MNHTIAWTILVPPQSEGAHTLFQKKHKQIKPVNQVFFPLEENFFPLQEPLEVQEVSAAGKIGPRPSGKALGHLSEIPHFFLSSSTPSTLSSVKTNTRFAPGKILNGRLSQRHLKC